MSSKGYFNGSSCYWFALLFLLAHSHPCSPFSIQPKSKTPSVTTSRETFLNSGLAVLIGSTSGLLLPAGPFAKSRDHRANAAMTVLANQLSSSAALRNVRSVQKKFGALELYVAEDQYSELREAIRVAPFSEIRKSCTTLVRAAALAAQEGDVVVEGGGGEGVVSSVGEELAARYKAFVYNFEKMDGTASLAMRGKKLKEGEFYGTYRATVAALDDFLLLAQEQQSPSPET
jgi:hypothetical protein